MRDVYFVYAHAVCWLLALTVYAVRVVIHGGFRSERGDRIGGTALVGRGIMDATYWILEPSVRTLARLGVTPDQLTWGSLGLAIGAAVAVANGWFGLACLLLTMSMLFDVLDGQVARATGVGSMRGEVLDSAIDRYCEMIYLGSLALFVGDVPWQLAIVIGAIIASFMVSYAAVMADAMNVTVPRGLMRRHERGISVIVGTGLVPLVGPTLADRWDLPAITTALAGCTLVAVIGNIAAVQKLVRIGRAV